MKIRVHILIFTFLIMLLFAKGLQAQVTIGSGVPPNKGSLLDLKSQDPGADNITSKKGMLLPRVALKQLGALNPIAVADPTDSDARLAHTGLMVYNVTNNPEGYINGIDGAKDADFSLVPCVYIWNGENWDNLGCAKDNQPEETSSLVIYCNPNSELITVNKDEVITETFDVQYTVTGSSAYTIAANSNIGSIGGFTTSIAEQVLLPGSGTLTVTVAGSSSTLMNDEALTFQIEGKSCTIYINVIANEPELTINCNPNPSAINVIVNRDTTIIVELDATITKPNYVLGANGNAGSAKGFTAGVDVQTLNAGDKIQVKISGTATAEFTNAPLEITLQGTTCIIYLNAIYPPTELTITDCNVDENKRTVFVGQEIDGYSYRVSYTSSTPGVTLPIYTKTENGVTVSYRPVVLQASGTILVSVSGTPLTATTSEVVLPFADATCSFTLEVVNLPILACPTESLLNVAGGVTLTGEQVLIPYTGGIPGSIMTATTSPQVSNGLTFTVAPTTVPASGEGNIVIAITGTVPTTGTSVLDLNLQITGDNGLDNGGGAIAALKVGCSDLFVEGELIEEVLGDYPNAYMVSPSATSFSFPVKKAYIAWGGNAELTGKKTWNATTAATVDIEWSSISGGFLDGTMADAVKLEGGNGEDAMIKLSLKNVGNGSFIVNYRKGGTIVWSWHIWVTDYATVAEGLSYNALMNQYLGATMGAAASTSIDGPEGRGFYYQWGRKDPFAKTKFKGKNVANDTNTFQFAVGADNAQEKVYANISTDEYDSTGNPVGFRYGMRYIDITSGGYNNPLLYEAVTAPFVFYGNNNNANLGDWYSSAAGVRDHTLWGGADGDAKGLFDPCPLGWSVPTHAELISSGMMNASSGIPSSQNASNAGVNTTGAGSWGYAVYNDESGNRIPVSGKVGFYEGKYQYPGHWSTIWTTSRGKGTAAQNNAENVNGSYAANFTVSASNVVSGMSSGGLTDTTLSITSRSIGAAVRCIKNVEK